MKLLPRHADAERNNFMIDGGGVPGPTMRKME
jgi:hypothetical protein